MDSVRVSPSMVTVATARPSAGAEPSVISRGVVFCWAATAPSCVVGMTKRTQTRARAKFMKRSVMAANITPEFLRRVFFIGRVLSRRLSFRLARSLQQERPDGHGYAEEGGAHADEDGLQGFGGRPGGCPGLARRDPDESPDRAEQPEPDRQFVDPAADAVVRGAACREQFFQGYAGEDAGHGDEADEGPAGQAVQVAPRRSGPFDRDLDQVDSPGVVSHSLYPQQEKKGGREVAGQEQVAEPPEGVGLQFGGHPGASGCPYLRTRVSLRFMEREG
jgi:hypothetical protein